MFESDDFDQVLSQFEFPELSNTNVATANDSNRSELCSADDRDIKKKSLELDSQPQQQLSTSKGIKCDEGAASNLNCLSPKHTKRKIINSFFDTKSKRKFPGPAGLLTGKLEENKDDRLYNVELLSQDVDFSQNPLRRDIFESPLWLRLNEDLNNWNIKNVDSIVTIKQQALTGNLKKRKAETVAAFVEAVDRSGIDPLIILRDASGSIKCTLHRDAWLIFSSYIVSDCCALVLTKPTVLTTGSAFKKHYLNITLGNIYAVYSSHTAKDEDEKVPDSFTKTYEEEFIVIRTEAQVLENTDISAISNNNSNLFEDQDVLLDGVDSSIFLDDIF